MITLFDFPPAFGLPSPGPFAIKTEIHLRMMGLEFQKRFDGRDKAPKGKLPYIIDGDEVVADSTFIRRYLERKYSRDLDDGLTLKQRAEAWAIERLAEDNLYYAMLHSRWAIDENFEKGPAHFFDHLPQAVQNDARQKQRIKILGYLDAQGIGRHNHEEIGYLANRGYDSLAQVLGDKPYLLGNAPTAVDASVFAQMVSALPALFESAVREAVLKHPSLIDYSKRMLSKYFPSFDSKQVTFVERS